MQQPIRLKKNPWEELTSRFEILDVFDFLENDSAPALFYLWCEKWSQHHFAFNQRLIIIDTDTDYYPENQSYPAGNNIYNFLYCCNKFSIPTEFIIFVSGTFNKAKEIHMLCDYFNLQKINVYEHLYLAGHTQTDQIVRDIDFDLDKIRRLFFCLNGTLRSYRGLLMCYLQHNNILEHGYFTYHFSSSVKTGETLTTVPANNTVPTIPLRYTTPLSRINDYFTKSKSDIEIYSQYHSTIITVKKSITDYPELSESGIWDLQPDFLKYGLINIVTETAFNYPYPYISEKTIKPILMKRPFISVAGLGLLEILKSFGFKTFSSVWDESYDIISDPSERLSAIVQLITDLTKKYSNNFIPLAEQIQGICEYNYNHYRESNFAVTGMARWAN